MVKDSKVKMDKEAGERSVQPEQGAVEPADPVIGSQEISEGNLSFKGSDNSRALDFKLRATDSLTVSICPIYKLESTKISILASILLFIYNYMLS